mgnify:CR=1 FL=1
MTNKEFDLIEDLRMIAAGKLPIGWSIGAETAEWAQGWIDRIDSGAVRLSVLVQADPLNRPTVERRHWNIGGIYE